MRDEKKISIERFAAAVFEAASQHPGAEVVSVGTGYRGDDWEYCIFLKSEGAETRIGIPCYSQQEEPEKIYYPTEEQIEDCYKFLGLGKIDTLSLSEAGLLEVEKELAKQFVWVSHPRFYQAIPKHVATGTLIFSQKEVERRLSKK